jgi:hypothetical protein
VPERLVLQKLLTAPLATAIVETGSDQVGSYVTEASAAVGLMTPGDLLAAYGVDASPQYVDVVRFEPPPLAKFSRPSGVERPWQTFPNGFLLGDSLAPVWYLERTRYSYGAEYWRIRSDGEQKRCHVMKALPEAGSAPDSGARPARSWAAWHGGGVASTSPMSSPKASC